MSRLKWIVSIVFGLLLAVVASAQNAGVVSKISPVYETHPLYWNGPNKDLRTYLNIPFYFNALYSGFSELSENLLTQRTSDSAFAPVLFNYRELNQRNNLRTAPENQLGLRLIAVRADQRRSSSNALAESGLFQPGDILLTFRPEWYTTLRYSHIQLGISHAGLLYLEKASDGKTYLKNLDMPLDSKHVGNGFLDSDHYLSTPTVHVVRPRNLTAKQRSNINGWVTLLAERGPRAYAEKVIAFNRDYSAPNYQAGVPLKFVGDIGRIALGQKLDETLTQFCSEFAWSVLSLRNCDPQDVFTVAEFDRTDAPSCITEIFPPMPVFGSITTATDVTDPNHTIGMADGISLIAKSQYQFEQDREERAALQKRLVRMMVFSSADGKGERISQNHLAVEESLGEQFFQAALNYYNAVLSATSETDPVVVGTRQAVNSGMAPNYSPTAFMVHTLLPSAASIRAMDYVGTIYYGNDVKLKDGRIVNAYRALRSVRIQ